MAASKPLPSVEYLRSKFDYDSSGALIAKSGPNAGRAVGWLNEKGYLHASCGGGKFFVHRLIWKMCKGYDPLVIDHINGNRADNRIENLRSVNFAANARSVRKLLGASKFKGVYAAKGGKWGARIKVDRTTKHLGTYACEMDAALAYDFAARDMHGEFAITNEYLGVLPLSEQGAR